MIEFKTFTQLDDKLIEVLLELDKLFFEQPMHREKLTERLSGKHLLIILAYDQEKEIGLKVGYELEDKIFHSWFGGVCIGYRKQGIARELMRRQHEWLKNHGYHKVRTHTHNIFKPMLILNLSEGFDVVGFDSSVEPAKIILQKDI